MLFERKFSIYIASFTAMCVFCVVIYQSDLKIKLLVWSPLFCIYLLLRYSTTSFYEKNLFKASNNPEYFERLNLFNAFFGGGIWGVSSLLFFSHLDPIQVVITIGMYTGLAAGSLATNAASMRASSAYIFSLFTPAIASCFLYPFQYSYYVAGMLTLALLSYIKCAAMIYDSLYKSVKASLEKEDLIRQVAQTNQKRLEAEKQSLQSAKLATLGEMAAGIAHEINNPLAIISGNIEMIQMQLKKSEVKIDLSRYIENCDRNIIRISNLVSSLKRMSYNNKEEIFEDVQIKKILEDAFSFSIEKMKHDGIKFNINIDDSDDYVYCNSLYISQVLLNLVNNSIHAVSKHDQPWINVTSKRDDKFIYLMVTDSGKGISAEVAKKIFDPFFTTKDINTGTGLGLSLSKNMAMRSGGDLYLDRGHKNTRFILKIPKSSEEIKKKAS